MPQIGGLSCVTPPANCQTLNAADQTVCDACNSNLWWNTASNPDACEACSTKDADCTTCNHDGVCSACQNSKVPQVGGDSCVTPASNCLTLSSTDKTECTTCNTNFWLNAVDTCESCSTIDSSCTTCTNEGVCTACSGGKVPQIGGLSCVTPPANCATISSSDSSKCTTCSAGFTLHSTTKQCLPCSAIENCLTCSFNSSSPNSISCSSCSEGMIPQQGF